jgi:chlorite dismutase
MSHGRPAAQHEENPAPETIEGWWILHRLFSIAPDADRAAISRDLTGSVPDGHRAVYQVVTHKADVMVIDYAKDPAALFALVEQLPGEVGDVELVFGYFSVTEASLYEATATAHGMLARRGLTPGKEGFDEAFAIELEQQKDHLQQRVWRSLPNQPYVCFYPMSKRRGEHVNWYDTSLDERRKIMRKHGSIGRKYVDRVTQIISGSTGLDDWEWGVDLHAADPLVFKKLIYEMRFDPASSRYAEFGQFFIGKQLDLAAWAAT